ncbi:hypothetical protein [Paenibacillus sp. Soil750]|uniref:hypothetical protein n=1 Tax=Paenibacillus sp. Soil750 TaxID=1736398 RepID=UPI0006F87AA5|nr:hypothetical protein [Paenibacillus sp. Soil750]KRE75411.1 hypothetical protein ASL11_00800 [Paenibacillus sp. Soil750]
MNALKKNLILIIFVFFSIYFSVYIQLTTINLAWLTWFFHLDIAEKFLNGSLVFSDLINRYGEHGMLGYNILFLVNTKLFNVNNFFDGYLNLIVIILSTLTIYSAYKKTLEKNNKYTFVSNVFFISIIFVMFSIIQQSSGAMETQVRLGPLFFLITCYFINKYFYLENNKSKYLLIISVMIILSILIFGTLYSFAWIPCIVLSGFIHYFLRKKMDNGYIYINILLVASMLFYFYMYSLFNPTDGSEGSFASKLLIIIHHPIDAFKVILSFIGSGTLGRSLWEDNIIVNKNIMLYNGLFIFVVYIISIVLFIKTKMWSKTYFPLMLIGYTICVALFVFFGRSQEFYFATNYWYAVHTKFGLVGCLWIIFYYIITVFARNEKAIDFNFLKKSKTLISLFCIVLIIFLSQLISNLVEWKRAPYIKQFYERMAPYAFTPYDLPINNEFGLTPLLNTVEETQRGIEIMRKYKLNIYHDFNHKYKFTNGDVLINGKNINALLGEGWYGLEGIQQWVNNESNITFNSGEMGQLSISGFIPEVLDSNEIKITVNNKLILQKNVSGKFTIEGTIPKNSIISMKINFTKSFVPNKLNNVNPDVRVLSGTIERITTK